MMDVGQSVQTNPKKRQSTHAIKQYVLWGMVSVIVALMVALTLSFVQYTAEDDYFLDSTLGELALWMADQTEEDEIISWLGAYATSRVPDGAEELDARVLLDDFRNGLLLYGGLMTLLAAVGGVLMALNQRGKHAVLTVALVGINALLFVMPPVAANHTVSVILLTVTLISLTLLIFSEHLERVVGFMVILALFTVAWEVSKAAANNLGYSVSVSVAAWEYDTYPALADALDAVNAGEIDAILADTRDLEELMSEYPPDDAEDAPEPDTLPYPALRYVRDFERATSQWAFPIEPELPGRVSLVATAEAAPQIRSLASIADWSLGAVTDSFAETRFLVEPREAILVDLGIANDLNLPHLQSIAEALMQPARRNGPILLVRILADAALYTWTEAFLGFVIGGVFGFMLGSLFAHINLLQRSLLPYVIASQTIPIIALAPMIVIWLRDTHPLIPVAIISAYLTFFPVTINTLRGLQSPDPMAFDLMRSYAASRWQIMWKLRFPAARPFIFTALKVSATASVVGAIIGELPSGVRDGLGRAILDFSSDYSLVSTPKLWGAIFMAALVGILFFMIVSIAEQVIVRDRED